MIDFKYLDTLPDALVELYADAETRILADMAERISAMDFYASAVQWQERMLQEMGLEHDYIIRELSSLSGKTTAEIEQLITDAGAEVLRQNAYLEGFNVAGISSSPRWTAQLAAGMKKTGMLFTNLTRTTANTSSRLFERACDQAYMDVTSGAFSPSDAVRNAVKRLSAQGIRTVEYHDGQVTYRTDNVDVAVRRAVLTGVNQTTAELQLAANAELGLDLVEVSAHAGARPSHAEWQGKIYSLSGKSDKYEDFYKATGYGTGQGLCGWNCRHTFYPYVEGSPRVWSQKDLDELEKPSIEYNGEMMTEYEATQIQRTMERNIRRWKREVIACESAGVPATDAERRLEAWQRKENDFAKQTGLKKQYDRTRVVEKVAKRHG